MKTFSLRTWLLTTALLLFSFAPIVAAEKESGTFKFVLLPDTQVYARSFPDIFYAQTKWIADQAEEIAFVLHLGDLTDQNTEPQWNVAEFSMRVLDGKVPYVLAQGNHDIGKSGHSDTRDSTFMNRFFPYDRYSKTKGFGGAFEPGKIDNVWFTFRAGGVDWLVLSLEFAPRDRVLQWADTIVEQHPRHKVILNTHGYGYSDDTLLGAKPEHKGQPRHYGIGKATGPDTANDGVAIWEKFVSRHANLMFVFSGHIGYDHGVGLVVEKGVHGNTVYQILADHQKRKQGGEGYLVILTADTKKATLDVKHYSPVLDKHLEQFGRQYVLENVDYGL